VQQRMGGGFLWKGMREIPVKPEVEVMKADVKR
jgi:hypothetical protein